MKDELGAAWRAAEAALPDYALLQVRRVPVWADKYDQQPCEAQVEWWEDIDRRYESAFGNTPAEALLALAEKFR